jgi:hypothetical protein
MKIGAAAEDVSEEEFSDHGDEDFEAGTVYRGVRVPPPRRNPRRNPRAAQASSSQAVHKKKPTISKKKATASQPAAVQHISYTKPSLSKQKFIEARMVNPYLVPRARGVDPRFWNRMQESIYTEVIITKKQKVAPQQLIDLKHIHENLVHFAGVLEKLEEFNLMPLVKFHQDYCEELVMQFFATVHFGTNEERTMTFMAGNEKRVVNFNVLADICGYTFMGDSVDQGLRIHASGEFLNRNKLKRLCDKGGRIGHVTGMKPLYYNLHRFYRRPLLPRQESRMRCVVLW